IKRVLFVRHIFERNIPIAERVKHSARNFPRQFLNIENRFFVDGPVLKKGQGDISVCLFCHRTSLFKSMKDSTLGRNNPLESVFSTSHDLGAVRSATASSGLCRKGITFRCSNS